MTEDRARMHLKYVGAEVVPYDDHDRQVHPDRWRAMVTRLTANFCKICGKFKGCKYPGADVYCWDCAFEKAKPARERVQALKGK